MKIEKLSNDQFRFTLWNSDLEAIDMKISELTEDKREKTDALVRMILERARDEYGFEAENTPIVIEAMQVNQECLILLITKLNSDSIESKKDRMRKLREGIADAGENPEASDKDIFSSLDNSDPGFGNGFIDPSSKDYSYEDVVITKNQEGPILPAPDPNEPFTPIPGFKDIKSEDKSDKQTEDASEKNSTKTSGKTNAARNCVFKFNDIEPLICIAKYSKEYYVSDNTLYKNSENDSYYIYATRNRNSDVEFQYLRNSMREFGEMVLYSSSAKYYMDEHYIVLIENNALQTLAEIGED